MIRVVLNVECVRLAKGWWSAIGGVIKWLDVHDRRKRIGLDCYDAWAVAYANYQCVQGVDGLQPFVRDARIGGRWRGSMCKLNPRHVFHCRKHAEVVGMVKGHDAAHPEADEGQHRGSYPYHLPRRARIHGLCAQFYHRDR